MKKIDLIKKAIMARSGVVFMTGKPGIGKTAILEQLATDMHLRYMDLRLSMIAEEDFMFPEVENHIIKTAIPEWAIESNKQPTLVVFEELNRASLAVRNASLQILLERRIGINFKFNSTVYFVATGNLGEADGTEVDDFDSALNNRLIHINFDLTVNDWLEGYANEKVHPLINSFLKAKPENFYRYTDSSAYATPRSWTFFSDLLISLYGKESKLSEIKQLSNEIGPSYVGNSILPFMNFLDNMEKINIEDVLNNFSKCEEIIKVANRDIISLLLISLKSLKCNELTSSQLKNVVSFLKLLSEDEIASYLIHVLNNEEFTDNKLNAYTLLFKDFKSLSTKLKENCL